MRKYDTVFTKNFLTEDRINLEKFYSWDFWEPMVKLFIISIGLAIIVIAIASDHLIQWNFRDIVSIKNPVVAWILFFNCIIFMVSLVFRTFLWFKYRTTDSRNVEKWPEITVLVPAYNEGETVYKTICSIAQSDYPEGYLRIISIDDGSTDNTFSYMLSAKEEYPHMVELIRFEKNTGKRQGIYEGFKNAVTDYVITVDSDTLLERNSIKELLTPLILNPKISAVTGKIKIWNGDANIFTKMLKANFAMAFDFTRAIQSTFSTVFCTSGAFTAYRRSTVMTFLDRWLNQTFLKRKCTFGEDRSLANFILRTGHGTLFQRTAVAYTIVPEKLSKILKMLTRWARSNIRESIVFSTLVFSKNRRGNHFLPFMEFFFTTIIVLTHMILFYYFLVSGFVDLNFLFRTLVYSVIFGFFYTLYYIRIEGKKDFPYILAFSLFSSFFMIWIFTVAGLTLNRKGWSTR